MLLAAGQQLKEVKVVMLGSTTVGKSSIVTRLTRGTFTEACASTIGAAFLSQTITVGAVQVKLQIWDTGGSERYRAMAPMYFQNAQAAIIVYDITSNSSFQDVETWLKDLKEKGPTSIIIGLAGNKLDLAAKRTVRAEEAQRFVSKHGIHVFKETSALEGTNINEIFYDIAAAIANGTPKLEVENVDISEITNKKEKSCC